MSLSNIFASASMFGLGTFFAEAEKMTLSALRDEIQRDALTQVLDPAGANSSVYRLREFLRGVHSVNSTLLDVPVGRTLTLDFSKCVKKIEAIKLVRAYSWRGLKEAKDFIEGLGFDNNIYAMQLNIDSSVVSSMEDIAKQFRNIGVEVCGR